MVYAVSILVPAVAAVAIAFLEPEERKLIRAVAMLAVLISLVSAVYAVLAFVLGKGAVIELSWLPLLNSYLYFKLTGLSSSLYLLTGILSFLSVLGSYSLKIENEKLYYSMLLLLFSGLYGVFSARDLLLFYLFWESVLIPMYFLIGVFGSENRKYAATKFFIYTFLASILMLVGLFLLASVSPSLKFEDLFRSSAMLDENLQLIAFFLIFLGFAVKLPSFPFHTWLPDAHVQAPTQASVLLAGVLLKMGGYGLFEILGPAFPQLANRFSFYFLALAAVSIVYGALSAYAQTDVKKLVAYSSVAHMGFVTAAFSAFSNEGSKIAAGYVMWAHGFITGLLFYLIGITYERFHSRDFSVVRHLTVRFPFLGWSFVFASMASLGLPGLAGFVGEFMTAAVAFEKHGFLSVLAIAGIFFNATYSLKLIKGVALTPVLPEEEKPQLEGRVSAIEKAVVWIFSAIIVISGLMPDVLIKILRKA